MAPRGRPPAGTFLDSDARGPVIAGVVDIDVHRRVELSKPMFDLLGWQEGPTDVLCVLTRGIAELLPWDPHGLAVLAHRRSLLDMNLDEVRDELRLLESRYKRVRIAKDLRVTLPPEILFHLSLPMKGNAKAHCIAFVNGYQLLSAAGHDSLLDEASTAFPDLP